jgi:hypothetical protein
MKKISFNLFLIVFLLCTSLSIYCNAQTDTIKGNAQTTCGDIDMLRGVLYPDGSRYAGYSETAPTTPSSFSSSAIFHCGVFDVYYDDVNLANGIGFDDPSVGAVRRSTFCAVLSYIQTVFDFSRISSTDKIKVHIAESYAHVTGHFAPTTATYLATTTPQYNAVPNAIIGGYLNDYVTTGVNTLPVGYYHAETQVNFDGFSYQDDYTASFGNCNIDLYSVLLHEMGHSMGFFSLVTFLPFTGSFIGTAPNPVLSGANSYSKLDNSITVGNVFPSGSTRTKLITGSGPYTLNTSLLCNNDYWVNNNDAPNNYAILSGEYVLGALITSQYIAHFDNQEVCYTSRDRVSPGDRLPNVMGLFSFKGIQKRTYSKADIQTFVNALGYSLLPAYSTANIYTNHLPFS